MQLDELDTRLDRLRATYEQYFVGIERIEPLVQRKDVERRFHDLRKMQLRNTASRFRFQSLVQKYTTYISHWQRICRRIEEGTYKRDLVRAQRYGKQLAERDAIQELGADAIEDASSEAYDDDDQPTMPPPPPTTSPKPVVVPPISASVRTGRGAIEEMPFDDDASEATPRPVPTPFRPATAPKPALPLRHPAPTAAPTGSAQLRTANAVYPATTQPAMPVPPAASAAPQPTSVQPAPARPPLPAPPVAAPTTSTRRVGFSPFGGAIPGAARGGAAANAKPPGSQPASTTSAAAAPPPAAPNPASARPASAPAAPAAPAPAPSVARPAAPPGEDFGLRALYERYRDTRQKNGEPEVAFETVAKQVRDSLPRLNEKYPGQQVTLDVGVKDGKTVLKPVVRPKE